MVALTLATENYEHEVEVEQRRGSMHVTSPYHPELVEELKRFDRARWTGSTWAFPANHRNLWQLEAMAGGECVQRYWDNPDPDIWTEADVHPLVNTVTGEDLKLRLKQFDMVQWALQKKQCIWAAEMRTGKTPAYFQVILEHQDKRWWIVAPKKVIKALRVEMRKWGFEAPHVELMTYNEMKKRVNDEWGVTEGCLPWGVVYDESSHLKGNSQRTRAAIKLSIAMDDRWGKNECMRILGTGTPMGLNHLDWYFQCEVARPGFLPWGNIHKFDQWLSVKEKMVGAQGQEYWSRVQWNDGADCVRCEGKGKVRKKRALGGYNEITCPTCRGECVTPDRVSELDNWLHQMVLVVLKKDVLELPEKEEVCLSLEPSATMLRVAKAITEQGLPAAEVLQRHRQLSDGFQYVREEVKDEDGNPVLNSKGEPKVKIRTVRGKHNPKMKAFKDLLDAHEEIGRMVAFGAYAASINWMCEVAAAKGWKVIRIDGKADVVPQWETEMDGVDALLKFDDREDKDKVVVIGHAKSMAYGFDLSASPGFVFYSLDYNGETFMQAIERGHSSGMNLELGCTLYFLECLPTDGLVRENVVTKKGVQDITVGNILDLYRSAA